MRLPDDDEASIIANSLVTDFEPQDGLVITRAIIQDKMERPRLYTALADIEMADLVAIATDARSYAEIKSRKESSALYSMATQAIKADLTGRKSQGVRVPSRSRRWKPVLWRLGQPRFSDQLSQPWTAFLTADGKSRARIVHLLGFNGVFGPTIEHFQASLPTDEIDSQATAFRTSCYDFSRSRRRHRKRYRVLTSVLSPRNSSREGTLQPQDTHAKAEPSDSDADATYDADSDFEKGTWKP